MVEILTLAVVAGSLMILIRATYNTFVTNETLDELRQDDLCEELNEIPRRLSLIELHLEKIAADDDRLLREMNLRNSQETIHAESIAELERIVAQGKRYQLALTALLNETIEDREVLEEKIAAVNTVLSENLELKKPRAWRGIVEEAVKILNSTDDEFYADGDGEGDIDE